MSFSQLEARVAAQYAVDTETQRKDPTWLAYRRVRYDMDGLVHRVTNLPGLGSAVHDEVMFELQPITGCGIPLTALAVEGKDDPTRVGFCTESEALTCMTCASERAGDGDTRRYGLKNLLFSAAYGKTSAQVMAAIGRQSGKSHLARQLLKHQTFNQAMVLGYAAHDAANRLGYVPTLVGRRRRLDAGTRRFGTSFMRCLARMVLPPAGR